MSILDNLRLMVRHYPGGINSLAPRLNKAVSTLEKELRCAEGFKLGALDAEEISAMCIEANSPHCYDYANALAARCGGFIELPASGPSQKPLQAVFADLMKEASDVLTCGVAGMSDGAFSDNSMKRFAIELAELLAKAQEVNCGIKALHEAGKRVRA